MYCLCRIVLRHVVYHIYLYSKVRPLVYSCTVFGRTCDKTSSSLMFTNVLQRAEILQVSDPRSKPKFEEVEISPGIFFSLSDINNKTPSITMV